MGGVEAPARRHRVATEPLGDGQAEHVQARRASYPRCEVEILGMTTEGDRVLDRALVGGKGLFIKGSGSRCWSGAPTWRCTRSGCPDGGVRAVCVGGDRGTRSARRVRVGEARVAERSTGRAWAVEPGRAAQIRRAPKLDAALRGGVNTRLARLDEGRYDAIAAAAGLKRLGLAERIRAIVPPSLCLPAAGQGALGIETLATRDDLRAWLAPLDDARTAVEVHAERTVSRLLGGSCRVPLAAWCVTTPRGGLKLVSRVAAEDGSAMVEAVAECAGADREAAGRIGEDAARSLREQGAARWLGSS